MTGKDQLKKLLEVTKAVIAEVDTGSDICENSKCMQKLRAVVKEAEISIKEIENILDKEKSNE